MGPHTSSSRKAREARPKGPVGCQDKQIEAEDEDEAGREDACAEMGRGAGAGAGAGTRTGVQKIM